MDAKGRRLLPGSDLDSSGPRWARAAPNGLGRSMRLRDMGASWRRRRQERDVGHGGDGGWPVAA
jgi:hypothetical protein